MASTSISFTTRRFRPEHLRLCRRDARGCPPARICRRRRAAGRSCRMVQGASRRPEKTRHDRARALGDSRRRHRRRRSRFAFRWSSAFTGRTCSSPSAMLPRGWPRVRRSIVRAGSPRAAKISDRARSAIGADAGRSNVIPYGVDSERFRPDADARARGRKMLGIADNVPLVFAVGRLVKKKGFEYLIDAAVALESAAPAAARRHCR